MTSQPSRKEKGEQYAHHQGSCERNKIIKEKRKKILIFLDGEISYVSASNIIQSSDVREGFNMSPDLLLLSIHLKQREY
jgi:hypothetical protein